MLDIVMLSFCLLSVIVLNVALLSVIMPNVVNLSLIKQSVDRLSVIILIVTTTSVEAPLQVRQPILPRRKLPSKKDLDRRASATSSF